MELDEQDLEKIVATVFPASNGNPAGFLLDFDSKKDMIYGIGATIAEYWSAYELYQNGCRLRDEGHEASVVGPWVKEQFPLRLKFHEQTDGANISNRSNTFIQFKDADGMKIKISGKKHASADTKSLSMSLSGEEIPDHRRGFFERFQETKYAAERTSFSSASSGIEKDWQGHGRDLAKTGNYSRHDITSLRQFMVRRACKFLIYDTIDREGSICYALDGIDVEHVARNAHLALDKTRSKVPVCTSELREIFRKWNYLRDHVQFYRHLDDVPPPWEGQPPAVIKAWADYALRRAQKLAANYKGKEADVLATRCHVIKTLHARSSFDQVILAYHEIPDWMMPTFLIPQPNE